MMTPLLLAAMLLAGTGQALDGDTLIVSDQHIRLCGIDAPEKGTAGSQAATAALRAILARGEVRCVPVGSGTPCDGRSPRMSHGRIVATCFVGGSDIAAELVRQGVACDWRRFSGGAHSGGCAK